MLAQIYDAVVGASEEFLNRVRVRQLQGGPTTCYHHLNQTELALAWLGIVLCTRVYFDAYCPMRRATPLTIRRPELWISLRTSSNFIGVRRALLTARVWSEPIARTATSADYSTHLDTFFQRPVGCSGGMVRVNGASSPVHCTVHLKYTLMFLSARNLVRLPLRPFSLDKIDYIGSVDPTVPGAVGWLARLLLCRETLLGCCLLTDLFQNGGFLESSVLPPDLEEEFREFSPLLRFVRQHPPRP